MCLESLKYTSHSELDEFLRRTKLITRRLFGRLISLVYNFILFFADTVARKYTEVACYFSKSTLKFEKNLWIAFNLVPQY
jgi:hypothetical protein